MGHQIVRQPDGLLAVWSSAVDDWVLFNATPEQLVNYYVEKATQQAREDTEKILAAVLEDRPRDVYYQFAMSFDECQELRFEEHGDDAPWPPIEA